jgi:TPR repeat protein
LSLATPSAAGPFEDGVGNYKIGYYVSAMKAWQPLADAGHAQAQANIGVMYREGQGVPVRPIDAYMWFSLSAQNGDRNAALERDLIARGFTPEQLTEAQRRVREWSQKREDEKMKREMANPGSGARQRGHYWVRPVLTPVAGLKIAVA